MASSVKDTISQAVKAAMRARDKNRLGILRMQMSEFKRVEVDERIDLDDTRVLAILDKSAKQRRDAAQQYRDAQRVDLAEVEEYEISVIQEFLPTALTDDELQNIVDAAALECGASSMADMGKLMALIKPQVQGRADMGQVSKLLKQKIA